MNRNSSDKIVIIIMYSIVSVFALICSYPLLLTLGVSFSDDGVVARTGYSVIPKVFSSYAYQYVFSQLGNKIIHGYMITIFVTIVGTFCSMIVTSSYAYSASMKSFKHRNLLNLLIYIPMVFSAGLLPWFIVLTKYYHLTNNIYALFVPSLINLFFVFLVRNFFYGVPVELSESARIDGAGHIRIFLMIYLPVARVGLTTVTLFYALSYWNDYYLALMLINNSQLYPLQYLLYYMLNNIQFITNNSSMQITQHIKVPLETVTMALTCVTIGPVIFLYPFAQRYFVKGIVIGAIKG